MTRKSRQGQATEPADEEIRQDELAVELEHEAAVLKAHADSTAAAGVELVRLEAQITDLDVKATRDREKARQKLKQAELDYNDKMDRIRTSFKTAVEPISAEAVAIRYRQKTDLDEALSSLRRLREKKLADLVEPRKSAIPKKNEGPIGPSGPGNPECGLIGPSGPGNPEGPIGPSGPSCTSSEEKKPSC